MKPVVCVAFATALLAAPAVHAQDGWHELVRETATPSSSTSTLPVNATRRFEDVQICAEGESVRLRRVEVRMDGRVWQQIDVPQVLAPGQCADPVDLRGSRRRIHWVRVEFETLGAGERPGTVVARAR
jgi:hypothetical protein